MNHLAILFFLGLVPNAWSDCHKPAPDEPTIGAHHGQMAESIAELEEQFEKIYDGPARIKNRTYKDSDGRYYILMDGKSQELPATFLEQIEAHLERALSLGYADFITYADMGHAHLLLPEDRPFSYSSPELKFLYHTAELLRLKDGSIVTGSVRSDPWLAWRYHSRNILVDNNRAHQLTILFARNQSYNTVRSLKGHRQVRTIYFTSQKDGCFSYQKKEKIYHFDITLE